MFSFLEKRFDNLQHEIDKLAKELDRQKDINTQTFNVLDDIFDAIKENKDFEALEKRISDLEKEHDKLRIDFDSTLPITEVKYDETGHPFIETGGKIWGG